MHARRFYLTLSSILLFATAACTLLLDRSSEQCASDGECAKFAAGAICSNNTCVSGLDGSTDGPIVPGIDGGQDGCVPIVPGSSTTNEQFLNACTPAACIPVDNCALIGLCDGGFLGPEPPTTAPPPTPPGPDSGATQTCIDVANSRSKQIVYVTGSSNFPPFLKAFAPVLAQTNYAVVWQTSSSCAGVDAIYNDVDDPTPDSTKKEMKERVGRITEFYDANGTAIPCTITGTVTADIGESDIYARTCAANVGYEPASPLVGEYLGPTMAMAFIVPQASNQEAISAEVAQAVYGRGKVPDPAKLPYDAPDQFFNRASSTATNQIISKGIFIDPTKWWGVDKRTAGNMADSMKQVTTQLAQKTIGIISTDFADGERGNIKTLAFQAYGQTCAFWPDSTPFAEDKANVRDGHYPLWGPLHFFARLEGGIPNLAAGAFVRLFSAPKLDQALVKGIIESHNVPACAMRVTRTEEMGPIKAFDPPYFCDCFFEATANGSTSCKECTGSQDCTPDKAPGRPACNYGYCEPR
jgi:hypothetical protein